MQVSNYFQPFSQTGNFLHHLLSKGFFVEDWAGFYHLLGKSKDEN